MRQHDGPTMQGFTLWFTGLPASGKTTIARAVERHIRARGREVEVIDGEQADADPKHTVCLSKLLTRRGVATLVAAVSPERQLRDNARREIRHFVEIHVTCSPHVLRDRRAMPPPGTPLAAGDNGVAASSTPYEEPGCPDLVLDTETEAVEMAAGRVIAKIEALGYLRSDIMASGYSDDEEQVVKDRLEALGYL
jgi:adenylylsulfate kinase